MGKDTDMDLNMDTDMDTKHGICENIRIWTLQGQGKNINVIYIFFYF